MENKVVLITGCNRGIGLEMARQYAAAGAKVRYSYFSVRIPQFLDLHLGHWSLPLNQW
jgi:NAD(P)-dependent dehydrogenase (short-subunit alcohol dehydrogenase family)